jgi:hypothetical protein
VIQIKSKGKKSLGFGKNDLNMRRELNFLHFKVSDGGFLHPAYGKLRTLLKGILSTDSMAP